MMERTYCMVLLLILPVIAGCVVIHSPPDSPGNPAAYHYQMGLSFLGERNYTGALVELTEAEKLDPENAELLYNLGMAYIGKKRPDLAEQKFQRALMLKPDYAAARYDLGFAYLELKRWDNAIQQFRIVKDDLFYDNSENAAINLGRAYMGKGDYQKALEELRTVEAGNPRNPIIHLSLGRVWFAMDNIEQAVDEYRKALAIHKDYGAAHYHLGLAYLKQKNLDGAKTAFKEVLRIFPESELGKASQGYLELIK